ncbi:MAG TPA: DinB family protein [Candidatus Limnocylindria bacterium]|nr:DinB family protein [Candidatus Limnocylindria bacterium]
MTFHLDDTFALLDRTPGTLREQLAGISSGWTESRPDAENWTAFQVVCHLAYIEQEDWLVRARMISEVGATEAFPPVDHGDQSARYTGQSLEQVLDRFSLLRRSNLEAVRPLVTDDAALDKRGLHPSLGEVTMRQLLSSWVVHDLNHVRQAQEAMAFRYVDEVGPWRVNLGVLNRPPA